MKQAAIVKGAALVSLLSLCFIASGFYFAFIQNVWIDETTQLSGATLDWSALFRWLSGQDPGRFGVPSDRMPPVSYLVDSVCWRTLCTQPTSFRLLHLGLCVAGLVVLLCLAARRFGLASALVVGLVTALSPKLIDIGVEIRAYPLFFATTCAQLVAFFALYDRKRLDAVSLGPLLLLSILAIYVHFYGLVSSMALLSGLFLTCARDARQAVTIIAAAAILILSAIGLLPFITGAVAISGGELPPLTTRLSDVLSFPFRILGHPSHGIRPVFGLLFFGSLVILLAVAIVRYGRPALRDFPSRRFSPVLGLLAAIVAGLAVTVLAALLFRGFDALKPPYSIWLLPVVALTAGAAVARPIETSRFRIMAFATIGCLTIGASMSLYVFLRHATWFVHGPSSVVSQAIQAAGQDTAVVYRGRWGYSYYPTYYRYGDAVSQWWIDEQGSLHRLTRGGAVEPAGGNLGDFKKIIFVDIRTESYATLSRLLDQREYGAAIASRAWSVESEPILAGWQAIQSRVEPGLYWASVTVLERKKL